MSLAGKKQHLMNANVNRFVYLIVGEKVGKRRIYTMRLWTMNK